MDATPASVAYDASRKTAAVERSAPYQWLVRAGFVARGVTYGVIGALALAIAVGAGEMGDTPNQEGALRLIAATPAGGAALVLVCAGLLAYAVWKFSQGFLGSGPEGGGGSNLIDRVGNLGGGVVYLAFFAVALRVLVGSGGSGSNQPKHAAAGVLGWPGGPAVVGVGGAVLIAISLIQLRDGLCGRFADDNKTERMGSTGRRLFMLLGRLGLTARSTVFALVGYFLVRTAIEFNPNNAVGLDGALSRLRQSPLGPWLLGIVALGLVIFAAYSLFEARYRQL